MKKGIFYSFLIFLLAVTFLKLSSNTKADFEAAAGIGLPYSIIENYPDGTRNEFKGISGHNNIDEILSDLNVQKLENDRTQAFPELKMKMGSQITVNHAPVIFVKDGKKKFEFRSWQKTVGELFAERNIEIGTDDKVNFVDDTDLENNMQIVITRVAITTVVEKETIAYKTVKKPNPNVEKGNKKTLQSGVKGSKDKYYLVRREDGEEVLRNFIKSEVTLEPVEEIIEVGTKVLVYGSGGASWYIRTSEMIGACNLVSRGTKVHVVNTANGKSIDIVTSGGGAFSGMGRVVDLSTAAFQALGASLGQGTIANVRVEKYYPPDD